MQCNQRLKCGQPLIKSIVTSIIYLTVEFQHPKVVYLVSCTPYINVRLESEYFIVHPSNSLLSAEYKLPIVQLSCFIFVLPS